MNKAPRYLRLMEAWRWSAPLWRSGVVGAIVADEQAADELSGIHGEINANPELSGLRPLIRAPDRRGGTDADDYLDAVCSDLLRGGPDPGINIPVTAALDRFCTRHGLAVARSATPSVAQRAETRLGQRAFSIAVPIVLRSDGETIASLRRLLEHELETLRTALLAAEHAALEGKDCPSSLQTAAEEYSEAFEDWASRHTGSDDSHAHRIMVGYVNISGIVMPSDAALRSSKVAVRAMTGSPRASGSRAGPRAAERASAERLIALIIREMNVKPERTPPYRST